MDRRAFLKRMGTAAALAAVGGPVFGSAAPNLLWLRRGSDQAQLDCNTAEGYLGARYLLRDVRAGVMGHPHPALLQLLCWEQAWLAAYGRHVCFDATSGLRTPATNDQTEGAARASTHLPDVYGVFRGADMRADGIATEYLGRLAALARQGGVGFYVDRGFVHQDVGRIRYWRR